MAVNDRGIILRGNTYHINRVIKGVQVRESLGTGDLRIARQRVEAIEQSIWLGTYQSSKQQREVKEVAQQQTLGAAYRKAFTLRWRDTKDSAGVEGRYKTILRFMPEDTPLKEITRARLVQFSADMREGAYTRQKGGKEYPYSTTTINRCLALLSTLLEVAADAGLIDSVPSFKKLKATERKRDRFFSPEEIQTMFRFLHNSKLERDHRCVRLFGFLLASACRLSEARNLTWETVDFSHRTITLFNTKSKKTVTKMLSDEGYAILQLEFREDRDYPFEGCSEIRIRDSWESALKAAGLEGDCDAVRHTLRHTAASWAVQRGVGLSQVQAFLGHCNIATTDRYAHLAVTHQAPVVEALDSVMSACCEWVGTRVLRDDSDSSNMRPLLKNSELHNSSIAQLVERRTVNP